MRYLKFYDDESKILDAINSHCRIEVVRSRGYGTYYNLSRMSVLSDVFEQIIKKHNLLLCKDYILSTKGWREKIFQWHLKKSRFGEIEIIRYLGGSIRRINAPTPEISKEAEDFYNNLHTKSTKEIVNTLHLEGKQEGIKLKRQLMRNGDY